MAKKKKNKKKSIVGNFLLWVLFVFSVLFVLLIMKLNILDTMHIYLVVGIIIVLFFFIMILVKKKSRIGCFLCLTLSSFYVLLCFNLGKTVDFLNNIELNYKTYHYSVVVLKDSKIHQLSDAYDCKMGYYNNGSNEAKKSLNKLKKKQEFDFIPYVDIHQMGEDLVQHKVDCILLENTYIDILDENLTFNDVSFKNLIRTIYDFVVIVKTEDFSQDINITKEPFNVYISGIDTYGEISSVSRSDVNIIVTVHPQTKQVLVTSIPRDYYVQLHGKNGYKDKLTHAGLYGVDMSIKTLEDLLDTKINYYVKVNFTSVVKIVDAIGGVKVYSDYKFTSLDNYSYKKGYNQLNGEEALSFARERKAFAIGDRQRIKNQQTLLKAIFDKVTSKSIITKYSRLLDSLNGAFVTNMSSNRLTSFIKYQLSGNYSWNLVMNSLNGTDSKNYTYSSPSLKSYVMEPDNDSVERASSDIKCILEGEKIDSDDEQKQEDKDMIDSHSNSFDSHTTYSSNNSTKSSNSNNNNNDSNNDFKVQLIRKNVEFTEGDTYIYHGYTATYQGSDVSLSSNITETFSVNGKTFSDYRELVLYVSRLAPGDYVISYYIQYNKKSASLKQHVTILKRHSLSSSDVVHQDDAVGASDVDDVD